MRYHVLRFDIWLCLAIGVVLSFGTGKLQADCKTHHPDDSQRLPQNISGVFRELSVPVSAF